VNPRGPRSNPAERGTLFYLLALLAAVSVVAAAGMTGSWHALLRSIPRERAEFDARWAAEGGIAFARASLARDPAWTGGSVPVGRGAAEVTVRPDPAEPADPHLREVVSIGSRPFGGPGGASAHARVVARVRVAGRRTFLFTWREE